ncbi:MAG TPA: enoyl-CoA hydratase-related protein [Geminicoccaceae bacterium]
MGGEVRLERDGAIARVVLSQPERLNAINDAMWDRLGEIMPALEADDDLRCVVLTGDGEKAFSVGADISEFEKNRSSVERARAYFARVHGALDGLARLKHPTIALIRGLCVGGGLEMALGCDLRICGTGSRFGIPIKRLGLTVSHAEMKPLVDLVGPSNALEILLEGQVFGAGRAYEMGLVTRVVPDAEVLGEVRATAERIAEGAPLVARWHKKFARRVLDPRPISDEEFDESFACFGTEDFAEGRRAFLEKRTPVFRGR